ncbi:hypothetical protein EDB85DRAFT_1986380 [Lactarius pseudohatsudake]|nr:hypothetical protein EDB85DRAFT_1986380 [Lactarius pseudohatsudake]
MTTTTRKPKMRVKVTMTRVAAAVLRVSCTVRSVSWVSCSCYRLARSWADMQTRPEIPGRSCCIACYSLACASLNCASFSQRVHNRTLTYLFMHNHSSSMAPKVGGAGLMPLYVVQCAILSWVRRIPEESRTDVHGALLAGLGGVIILLAFFETWLGLISGRPTVPSLYAIGVMTAQRRFGAVKADAKGEYVALDMRPPSNNELEDGDEKL